MVRAVLDTCILIDHLNGIEMARDEIARHDSPAISVVTWMEVMVGARGQHEQPTRTFLARFKHLPIDGPVAELAVDIRRRTRIRLPDAIIAATARVNRALLVTRNMRDFDPDDPGVRIPYRLP